MTLVHPGNVQSPAFRNLIIAVPALSGPDNHISVNKSIVLINVYKNWKFGLYLGLIQDMYKR